MGHVGRRAMGGIRIGLGAAALALLTGCVGYGYPSGGYEGGYPGAGGYPGDGYPGGGYGHGSGSTVRCESDEGRTRHCRVDTRGGVSITRQLSRTACVQGRNWGWDNSGVWVTQGCRAEFVTGRGGGYAPGHPSGPGAGYGQVVRCESDRGRHRRCDVQVGRGVDLVRQLSETRCVRGQNWGWDRGGIWVDAGCRAEFRVR
ncbi:DUF3011 domain-containing protein [Luteimonas viscosa]|uniref:DUF3011 domain-containing protein n=2 Tax=Luteimonas viscosa TaxID=1132694 RepID=A0A5D4XID1_9GAMM|nr:DUF3011 domain-containing protein [Luteimonas viscosa]